jgi:hypothetical protein
MTHCCPLLEVGIQQEWHQRSLIETRMVSPAQSKEQWQVDQREMLERWLLTAALKR